MVITDTNIPVDIQNSNGTARVYINQQLNGGKWNSLGQYTFNAGTLYKITITSQRDPTSTCADAVKFTLISAVNNPPVAAIDSIAPNPSIVDQSVSFTGHGTDTDGNVVAYNWTSSIDANLSNTASFSTAVLSQGQHTITFKVQDNKGTWSQPVNQSLIIQAATNIPPAAIIDSITPNPSTVAQSVSFSGHGTDSDGNVVAYNWASSIDANLSNTASFSTVALSQGQHTITFKVQDNKGTWSQPVNESLIIQAATNIPPAAIIDSITPNPSTVAQSVSFSGHGTDSDGNVVAYNWTSNIDANLSNTASFSTVALSQGQHTITFKVQDNKGAWSLPVTRNLVVNAVSSEVIIDNGAAGTSSTGPWTASGAPNPYGANSVWSYSGATYTWSFKPTVTGTYRVSMWWTALSSRSSSVPVTIQYSGGTANAAINQQQNGGMWNVIGEYAFNAGTTYNIKITAPAGSPPSTCADAVKFTLTSSVNIPPVAVIDSITPNPSIVGQSVSFTGHGTDSDGTITAYNWTSSIDANLSNTASFLTVALSQGQHTVTFKVQDNKGVWSSPVTQNLVIAPAEKIIDNRDAATSKTGTWQVSGAPGFYGQDAVWSRDGATFSFNFTPTLSGLYGLSMWWTQWPSRSTNIPVDIQNSNGTTRVYINQQVNGGKWNSIGQYTFTAGILYKITITSQSDPTSTCADAVKLTFVNVVNTPPVAVIDSINPDPAMPGDRITLQGSGSDSDGTVVAYNWRSSINGTLGTSKTLSTSSLSAGTHTIYFKVQDNKGLWSPEVSATLDIGLEHIYVACAYGGKTDEKPMMTSMLQNIGAVQNGDVWTYIDQNKHKTYIITFVNDLPGIVDALTTFGAHVILSAHSNYGLGPCFATASERNNEMIEDITYIDDDRILNLASPWVSVSISGMRTGQAYPYWWPTYKDGTSGIMPYDFNDPNGDPAYNYYLTYQIPGDPEYYKVETVNNSAVKRYWDCGKEAWYSTTGAVPNPKDPNDQKYYITNTASWSPSFQTAGTWFQYQDLPAQRDNSEYFKENYIYKTAGTGNAYAKWLFHIPTAGNYVISAWWPAASSNASNAPYTITYPGGNTTVKVDQRINGRRWNSLGQFYFDANDYSVTLKDNASSGRVIADGIRISHANNPPEVVQADFVAETRSGPAPLTVEFENNSSGDLTDRTWNMGDGYTNTTRDEIEHIYTSPGTYNVSLTVSGPLGSSTRTKTGYIRVWSGTQEPPLQAEFDARGKSGAVPRSVRFSDLSTGDLSDVNESWLWDFGDGQTSHAQNPTHVYSAVGNYTVKLTVKDPSGATSSETKQNFVRVIVYEKNIDNVDYPKTHFSSKTMLYTKELGVQEDNIKYSRLLYGSCNSANYFIDLFHRGVFYYAVNTSGEEEPVVYLQSYLQGKSDYEIWQDMQAVSPVYDYYNFNLPPGQAQQQSTLVAAAASTMTPQAAPLDAEQQAQIRQLKKLSVSDAFEKLQGNKFLVNERFLERAISATYTGSKEQAVELALAHINTPSIDIVDGVRVKRMKDFHIAKKILHQFPEISCEQLLLFYYCGSPSTKANVILAAGGLADQQQIYDMLINALDDKTVCENDKSEFDGEPLRICDLAYNQLVLNLQITGVLRTIRTDQNIDQRDYHIDMLKKQL